ncbi:helix-turn-helix domain-containing protein [Dictyobacter kobayashii]|uniref:HTH cro/C1-type domain-containing protein n=1 Tax=Dictyobacter kobayashii TaxID=2014872 RepID=A0A402AHF1_9CHLR|nr:helix-turn-helix transcriptional regulator [Dictyobacter kobayashii]GCE18483.1 hypothetical protein KDK_22830 [Dictyobacter kobayashii]
MESFQQKNFSEVVKYQREIRGWSQARMAEELGTTPNRISSWERGVSVPSAYFREKLCTHLDMDAHELGLVQVTPPASTSIITQEPPTTPAAPEMDVVTATGPEYALQPARKRRPLLIATLILLIVLIAAMLTAYSSGFISFGPPNPYAPHTGHLALNDTLQQPDSTSDWQQGANETQARCLFKNNTYVAYQPLAGFFHACIAQKTDYANFAYEVEMNIQQGEFGGIVFRSEDSIDGHYYLFRVHTDGSYWFYRFADHSIGHATLLDQGNCGAFNKGLNQPNLLAVVAQNDILTLYINRQEVSSIHDAGYTHGQIGLLAGSITTGPAEVDFKNVRVWIL